MISPTSGIDLAETESQIDLESIETSLEMSDASEADGTCSPPTAEAEPGNINDMAGLEIRDDPVGDGKAVASGDKVLIWYTAKVYGTDHVYERMDSSNGDPASRSRLR